MAANERELLIRIAGKLDGSLSSAAAQAQSQLSGIGSALKNMGAMALGGLGLYSVGSVVTDAVNTYKDFDQAMAMTAATAGATGAAYDKLQQAALDAGRGTTKTATESAEALGYLALAGFNVDESCSALMPILKLSEATMMDLATCSDLVTDSMSATGVTVGELPGYLDILCKANNKSNQTAQQLMEAMLKVGGTMKGLNVPIEETSTALGVLANRGLKGAEGGTALNSIMANLTTGTGEAGKMMAKLGVSAFDAEGKFIGVQATLTKLAEATAGLTEEERNAAYAAIGGKEQVKALNALMAGLTTTTADGRTEWNALREELDNAGGSLDAMNAQVTNTLNGAMSRFGSALDDIKIRAMLAFGPTLTKMIDALSGTVMPQVSAAMEKIPAVLDVILNEATYVFNLFTDNWSTIGPVVEAIGIALGGWKLTALAADLAVVVTETLALKAAELEYTVVSAAKNVQLFLTSSAFRAATLASMQSAIATKAHIIADNAYVIATSLATAATTTFSTAVAFLTSPIGLAIMAIMALVGVGVLLYKNWDVVVQKAQEFCDSITSTFPALIPVVNAVVSTITGIFGGLKNVFDGVVNFVKDLFTGDFANLGADIEQIFSGIWDTVSNVAISQIRLLGAVIQSGLNALGIDPAALVEKITAGFEAIKAGASGVLSEVIAFVTGKASAIGQAVSEVWENSFLMKSVIPKLIGPLARLQSAIIGRFLAIKDGINNVWNMIVAGARAYIQMYVNIFTTVVNGIKAVFTPIAATVMNVFTAIGSRLNAWWQNLVTMIGALTAPIISTITGIFTAISATVTGWWNSFISTIAGWYDAVAAVFTAIGTGIVTVITVYLDMVYAAWVAWGAAIIAAFDTCVAGIQTAIGFFTDALVSIIDFLTNVFMGNWEAAWTSVVQTFSNIFSGIQAAASAPINAVIALINSLIASINSISFDIPDFVPGLGGKHFSFNVPSVPALAEGGITNGPTLAMIGEGAEQEAVIPLSKLRGLLGTVAQGEQNINITSPDVIVPEIKIPDVAVSEIQVPDVVVPEIKIPDVISSEIKIPDVAVPEIKAPNITMPNVVMPEINAPDITMPKQQDNSVSLLDKIGGLFGIMPPEVQEEKAHGLPDVGSMISSTQTTNNTNNSESMNITFSPQITINGNADKNVLESAAQDMYKQFKSFMERFQRDNRRLNFSY